jgi:hypothetical protein
MSAEDDVRADLESVTAAAKRLLKSGKLTEEGVERYITDHMTGFGHKASLSWLPGEGGGKDDNKKNFFGMTD